MDDRNNKPGPAVGRRGFLKLSGAAAAAAASAAAQQSSSEDDWVTVDEFDRPDSLYHGDGWESMNPGYWRLQGGALRRKLANIGDRNPGHWFPWHWETHRGRPMPVDVDPSLPLGMIWRRDWRLRGNYAVRAEFTVRRPAVHAPQPKYKQEAPGYALMGVCFGGRTLFESLEVVSPRAEGGGRSSEPGQAAWMAVWRDDNSFGILDHALEGPQPAQGSELQTAPALRSGDRAIIEVEVSGDDDARATVTATLSAGSRQARVTIENVDRRKFTEGFFGLTARGLLDFEVTRVSVRPDASEPIGIALNECHVCYPLGHTLRQAGGQWRCRFVAMFRNDGERAELRISDSPEPDGGWGDVPAAGAGKIVNNGFRRNTAVIEAALPASPAEKTLYYTVWKDGRDVTADPRVDHPEMTAPGTGLTEPAPDSGKYVGRLPRLQAPYRLAGLGGHALQTGGPNLPDHRPFLENWVYDQPTPRAYRHLEEYDLQILVWEDDVWYLELMFSPPSTDDAYRVITSTIAGPTTRWQFMRHWNIINPGDHDFGMDDIKGPEQYIIRNVDGLGQDMRYMRRNYQIVTHLTEADENPSGTSNPKLWHRWKMPQGDFTLLVLDARRWRTSQETDIWDEWGWGHKQNLLSRRDPTRTLLGEEQFAWLQEVLRNDSSPLICLAGINCMHNIFTGWLKDPDTGLMFAERDRVAADYAGWSSAGCDRVIHLLGGRQGVVTVYGDIHLASIVENVEQRLFECSFGPIGRTGSRDVKEGFGPRMKDYEGREVQVHALYHDEYGSPDLKPREGPKIWNFLEMHFDPRPADPLIRLRIRNIIDAPSAAPRGGGFVERKASQTGRKPASKLPAVQTLPDADVRIATVNNLPVRGLRSRPDGSLPLRELIGVPPGTRVVLTAVNGDDSDAQVVTTEPV